MIGEEGRISVKRGRDNLQKDFTPFFKENEIVRVKFSSLGEEGYAFWRSFEDMAALSRIPLMPVNSNLKSNVQGALGYWLGYGSSFYEVRIWRGKLRNQKSPNPKALCLPRPVLCRGLSPFACQP